MKTILRILVIVLVIGSISGAFYLINAQNTSTSTEGFQPNSSLQGERPEPPSGEGFEGRGSHSEGGMVDLSANLLKISAIVLVIAGSSWAIEKVKAKKMLKVA